MRVCLELLRSSDATGKVLELSTLLHCVVVWHLTSMRRACVIAPVRVHPAIKVPGSWSQQLLSPMWLEVTHPGRQLTGRLGGGTGLPLTRSMCCAPLRLSFSQVWSTGVCGQLCCVISPATCCRRRSTSGCIQVLGADGGCMMGGATTVAQA
jgi:hypothetical protein